MVNWSLVLSVAGMGLSLYALHVESQHDNYLHGSFESLCDIKPFKLLGFEFPKSSCSEVFSHPAGKIWSYLGLIPKDSVLDQPNALYGFVFYVFIAIASFAKKNVAVAHAALLFGTFSVALSAYLAYTLAFVMHHFCVLCVSTYVCNTGIFADGYSNLRVLRKAAKERKAAAAAKSK